METKETQDGRAWAENENSPRAMQLGKCTLKEFREVFVDDRPLGADAIYRQINVQSKAVFSCAMTLMDKINGWEDEERWVGSKFAAYMWIYTKEALTGGQILNREQEMSIMLCTNCVCAGTFVDHGWVSSRTIIQQEEEILCMELNYKIDVPCVVQWSLLWFSAPTNLNRILVRDLNIKKYLEVVNSAVTDATVRPFGREHTTEACMVTSVARCCTEHTRKWGVNKEMEGWMTRGNLAPSTSDGDDDEDVSGDE